MVREQEGGWDCAPGACKGPTDPACPVPCSWDFRRLLPHVLVRLSQAAGHTWTTRGRSHPLATPGQPCGPRNLPCRIPTIETSVPATPVCRGSGRGRNARSQRRLSSAVKTLARAPGFNPTLLRAGVTSGMPSNLSLPVAPSAKWEYQPSGAFVCRGTHQAPFCALSAHYLGRSLQQPNRL